MSSAPYCKTGKRRCSVSKKCVTKKGSRSTKKCNKGSRKCANGLCYRKHKSSKSRRRFTAKYGRK